MPIEVELPDGVIAEFPDEMSDDDIRSALRSRFSSGPQAPQVLEPPSTLRTPIISEPPSTLRKPIIQSPFTEQEFALADPEYGGVLSRMTTEAQPYEVMQRGIPSALGITPSIIPSGREISESPLGVVGGVAGEPIATVASSVAKTGLGIADYLSSRQGTAELIGSMSPARVLVMAKWAKDMAQGAGEHAGQLVELIRKKNKTPEDWQAISDNTVNTIAMVLGSGTTAFKAKAEVGKLAKDLNMPEGKFQVEDRGDVAQEIFNRDQAVRQAEAGSPFTRLEPPSETISMGVRTQPPLTEAFGPERPTFDPSGLRLSPPTEPLAGEAQAIQPPAPPMAPGPRPVSATTKVRLQGEAAQRLADFEKAMAEKVSQEQSPSAHPDKPLTENQLRIIRESLQNQILEGQIPGERPGILSGSALEKWADETLADGSWRTKASMNPFGAATTAAKNTAALVVKGAALLERGIIDLAKWSSEMVSEYGEGIRPFLERIRKESEQLLNGTTRERTSDAVQQEAAGAVRDVLQPEVTPESARQVPTPESGAKAPETRLEHTLESDKALHKEISDSMLRLVRSGQASSPLMEVLKRELEIVKNRHEGMPPGQTSPARKTMETKPDELRIELANEIQPAVRIGGRIISDPNKGHIAMALEIGGADAIAEVSKPVNQGFLYKGEFISREAASTLLGEKTPLTSERLKEIRSSKGGVESGKETKGTQEGVLEPAKDSIEQWFDDAIKKVEFGTDWRGQTSMGVAKIPVWLTQEAAALALRTAKFAYTIGRDAYVAIQAGLDSIRKTKGFNEAEATEWLKSQFDSEPTGKLKMASEPTSAPASTPPPIPEPPRTTADPITGEPAKLVTEKAARAMESKVSIPAQKDVTKISEQIDLFNREIGDALESGGQFLPKELRPDVAKGAPAERGTVTNREINQYFVNKLSSIRKQMQAAKNRIAQTADVESQMYFDTLQKRFETAFRQVQELRRASHEALYFWNRIRAEYQDIARAAGEMPEMKKQIPILDQIWKDFRDGKPLDAGKHAVDYLRMNLFTVGSWTLDFGTNLVASATKLPAWAIMDLGSLVTGNAPTKMFSAIRALQNGMRNWNPLGKRYRLSDAIESELGTTAGGEFGGKGREVLVDFSEILRDRPELADKLRHIDKVIGAPIRMKRAVDSFFGRFGAAAELYSRAYKEGRGKGLRGDELKTFVEDFVQNPPEAALNSALKTGKELKFNRDLTKFEEAFSGNIVTKLVLEAFPRWTFQFIRWGGEMLGIDPSFFKKVATGKATPEETVNYLTKAATGWGGVYAFNQLFYDNVDANSMEYVKEDGNRVRLSGRTPAPELFFICALLRGDTEKAKAALQHLSVPGAKFISGEPAGIISPLFDTIRESIKGRYTAEMTARELTKLINDAIPGKSVLGLIRSIFDPTVREGVGAPIPGVASTLPQRINPTTGEPLAPKTRIPGTSIELPTVGGTPFPGAERVLNDVESALLDHGLGLTRPRRTSIIDLPAEDVPKEVRREYEKMVGDNVKQFVGDVIKTDEFKSLPFEVRRDVLSELLTVSRTVAKGDMAQKHGTGMSPLKSDPLNVQRLPERLRK